eukprot:TRINITY_DN3013_c0_g1_i9.p1 TRINITY_DN3013_c0_g1~~TRINITY_DN3013_c0_g1_i9.p1  ORF type:complete len:487 (-),score=93.32 TRINITY_DN3013_c0_g1_i9:125-1585(-)
MSQGASSSSPPSTPDTTPQPSQDVTTTSTSTKSNNNNNNNSSSSTSNTGNTTTSPSPTPSASTTDDKPNEGSSSINTTPTTPTTTTTTSNTNTNTSNTINEATKQPRSNLTQPGTTTTPSTPLTNNPTSTTSTPMTPTTLTTLTTTEDSTNASSSLSNSQNGSFPPTSTSTGNPTPSTLSPSQPALSTTTLSSSTVYPEQTIPAVTLQNPSPNSLDADRGFASSFPDTPGNQQASSSNPGANVEAGRNGTPHFMRMESPMPNVGSSTPASGKFPNAASFLSDYEAGFQRQINPDERHHWIANILQLSFNCDMDWLMDNITEDVAMDLIDEFFTPEGPNTILFYYIAAEENEEKLRDLYGDDVEAEPELLITHGDLDKYTGHGVYFLKTEPNVGITVRNFKRCLDYGQIQASVLSSFETMITELYFPMLSSQQVWGKTSQRNAKEFLIGFKKFANSLSSTVQDLTSGVELAKPEKKFEVETRQQVKD